MKTMKIKYLNPAWYWKHARGISISKIKIIYISDQYANFFIY
jgi:hypothetical protein